VLAPLALLFQIAAGLRSWMYAAGWLRVQTTGAPVVVVGNLTVGGTGKTPLVAWLAQRLSERSFRVGILSRGYGGAAPGALHVKADTSWRVAGDEARMLSEQTNVDVVVARDRVAGAKLLLEQGANLILCDDGLQHLRLARACEIVVIDGERGIGNGLLLPAGPLRQSTARLKTVDVIVINGDGEARTRLGMRPQPVLTMHLRPLRVESVADRGSIQPLEWLRGQKVHALAGIGNPSRFFAMLQALGASIVKHPFADHYTIGAQDLQFGDTLPIVMTEKDAVKCREFALANCWFVPVEAVFAPDAAQALLDAITHSLRT
jgi:tetraacyldisaccharide 4'-kinase